MARRAAAARDPMGSLFFTQVKNKALSLPGLPRIWKRDKEREDTMKKKLSALLLGLALTLVLLTVTAWASESRTPTLNDVDPTIQVKFVCNDFSWHTASLDLSADYSWIASNGGGWDLVIDPTAALRTYYVQHGVNGPHRIADGVVDTISLTWDDSAKQWENKSEQTLTIPMKCIPFPDETGLQSLLGQVTLQCTHDSSHTERFDILHSSYSYIRDTLSYNNGVFSRQVRIKLEYYLKDINELDKYTSKNIHHIFAGGPDKIDLTLQYDVAKDEWSSSSGNPPLVFNMTCEKPALPDFDYSKLSVKLSNAGTYQDCGTIPLDESLIDWDHSGYDWNSLERFWFYELAINSEKLLADYNAQHNTNYLLVRDGTIWSKYNIDTDTDTKTWDIGESAYFTVAPAPSVNELKALGLTANVVCKDSKHTLKSFTLSDNQLTFTRVWNEKEGRYEYRVSLTDDAANTLVAQYGSAIGKSHTKQSVTSVTMYWDDGDGGVSMLSLENSIAVQAETEPPREGWQLTGPKIITVTAACTSGGTHTGPAKNPYQQETTVTSAKTFDGGVALYAGLTLLSLTGTALTVRRKER